MMTPRAADAAGCIHPAPTRSSHQQPENIAASSRRSRCCTNSYSAVRAKLHYSDTAATNTSNEHHQRTSSRQLYNLLYDKVTTNGQKFATSHHLDVSRCWALALRCGKLLELLRARPLVVSVASVRAVEFGPYSDRLHGCAINK